MPTEAPPPPSLPAQHDAGRSAAVERALQGAVLDSVLPAVRAVALLYLPFAATTWLVAPAPVALPMTAIDLASALVLGLLDWRLRRGPVDPRLANPLAVVVASVVLLNSASDQWLVPEAYLTTNFILLAIAAGYIILSPRYLAGLLAAILAAWGAVALAALSSVPGARAAEWSQFGLSLLGAVALAGILHAARVRTLGRLETLRVENEAAKGALRERTEELERALVRAGEAVDHAETLRAAAEALSQSLDLQQVLQLILTELRKVVEFDSASVQELEGRTLRVIAGVGFPNLEEILGLTFDIDDPSAPNREVVRTRAPLTVSDTSPYPPFRSGYNASAPILCWMGVPLLRGDRLIGLITLDKRQSGFYTDQHARLAVTFAAQAAVSIENARLFEGEHRHAAELERYARDLEQARGAAEEASRAKSAFVASMSHELRTPLNAVLGFAQLMQRRPGRDAEDREHLAIVSRAGGHLLSLINNVLSLAKIESGRMTLDAADFDLAELLEGVGAMFRGRAAEKSLSFTVEAAALPPSLRGDSGKLRQILINLLANAFKFTEAGGVVLRGSWSAGRAVFEVEDTGFGMRPDEVERLFTPFVQAEAGKRQPGTGLGLALSRSYAQLMDGDLTVTSVPGRSSVFRVEVALPEGAAAAGEARRGRILRLAPGQRRVGVIVADDDADGRLLLRGLLGRIGFDVRAVANGREALAEWRRERPDFVWMDMSMPVMDGMEATRRIRAEEKAAGLGRTAIAALSATALDHEREAILAAGCDDFVAKPFAEAAVLGLLAQRLNLRYEYEDPPGPGVAPAGAEAEERLTRERLDALPTDWRARFREMVERGDSVEAARLIVEIEPLDATISSTLRALLKDYRLADIERLIAAPTADERRPAASE